MDSIYDDYYDQALNLQNHYSDVVDNQRQPQAMSLEREIHQLTQDFRARKNPRHMDDRLKTIEHQLLQARTQGEQIMSYQDIDTLQHQYRRLREQVRSLPDF